MFYLFAVICLLSIDKEKSDGHNIALAIAAVGCGVIGWL